ncbi:hypothetical protein AB1E18_001868 [Capra hircus]
MKEPWGCHLTEGEDHFMAFITLHLPGELIFLFLGKEEQLRKDLSSEHILSPRTRLPLSNTPVPVPAVLKLACADTSLNDLVDFITGFNVIVVPLSLIVLVYVNIFATIMKIRSAQGRVKAFSTCASHITVVTMFAIPCIITYMSPGSDSWSNSGKKMALFYNIATAFLNPVIYSLRNKDVKNAFLKLMGRGRDPE